MTEEEGRTTMDPWNDIVDALAGAAREMWGGAEPRRCDGLAIAGESVVAMIGYAGDRKSVV